MPLYRRIANSIFFSARAFCTLLLMPGLVLAQEQADKVQKALPHTPAEQMIKTVLGLLFVLVLIFLIAWLFKKYGGGGLVYNRSLRTIAGVSVGQKERVVLVQVGERQIVVGVAPGQVNLLHLLEAGEEVKFPEAGDKSPFAEKLKQSLTRVEKQ